MIVFRSYRRVIPTRARVLTAEDVAIYQGSIKTPEGDVSFVAGDYLACDSKGMWPIKEQKINQHYIQVEDPDAEGFALYLYDGVRIAACMPEPFHISGLQGKAGDYLVIENGSGWPVDRELFEQTYALIDETSV